MKIWTPEDHFLGLLYLQNGYRIREIAHYLGKTVAQVGCHYLEFKKQWAMNASEQTWKKKS